MPKVLGHLNGKSIIFNLNEVSNNLQNILVNRGNLNIQLTLMNIKIESTMKMKILLSFLVNKVLGMSRFPVKLVSNKILEFKNEFYKILI